MKLGIISDLHVDRNERRGSIRMMDVLSQVAQEKQVDYLLIAGDISSDYKQTLEALQQLKEKSGIPYLFVPGNHDVWNLHYPHMKAWDIYKELQQDPYNLTSQPFALNNEWLVIGDIGWYDYSFGSSDYELTAFDAMKLKGRTWQDSLYADWQQSTHSTHRHFYDKLKKQLKEHKDKKIIVLTHVVSLAQFTVPLPNRIWGYFNAFLGSEQYGQLMLEHNVQYAICGHVHYRKQTRIENTTFICSCLGYTREWRQPDPFLEISNTLVTVDI